MASTTDKEEGALSPSVVMVPLSAFSLMPSLSSRLPPSSLAASPAHKMLLREPDAWHWLQTDGGL